MNRDTFFKVGNQRAVSFIAAVLLFVMFALPVTVLADDPPLEAPVTPGAGDLYQWVLERVRADEAWNLGAMGQGIIVAVVDSGVETNHPALRANITLGYNAITQSVLPIDYEDDHGHGTMMSGAIAADDFDSGLKGVAWQAKIMPIKAIDASGEGDERNIARGVIWAADHGANIINLSMASTRSSQVLENALNYAVGKGCLIVSASGNTTEIITEGVAYPGAYRDTIAISATDTADIITSFTLTGPEVVLSAPGAQVLTTYPSYLGSGGGLAFTSGTSIAAAVASGVAALVWSSNPGLTATEVLHALEASATDLGRSGRDDEYGYGRVDAYRAIQTLAPPQVYTSPALLNWGGGSVDSGDGARLLIPAGSFTLPIVSGIEASHPVSLQPEDSVLFALEGAEASGSAYSVLWSGNSDKALTLTLPLGTFSPGGTAYIYCLQGSRWVKVGGGVSVSPGGQVSASIFQPGIYQAAVESGVAEEGRLSGTDRIFTALETAHAAFPQGANAVVIARADDYPDALAGVPLAYKLQAPLLLTFPHSLPVEVFQSIQNMAPSAIYILGGDAAVSVPVARQLSTIAPITRLYGSDRYETAAAVARQLDNLGSAVIVNGLNYPDAVSVAAAAGRTGVPILLTDKDTLPEVTAKALRTLNITQVTVVGGAGVISDSVLAALPNPTRLAGADRYDTSAAVIRAFPGDGARLYIATGRNFPDALTGGLLAALNNTSILLVDPLGLTPQQRSLLTTLRGKKAVALGGSASVSEEIMSEVRALLAN